MTKNEENLTESLSGALESKSAGPQPEFDETWLAAETRFLASKRQYRKITSIAIAVTLVAIVLALLPDEETTTLPDFEIVAEMMESTSWTAPSDILMPEYAIDVYGDFQQFPVSTDLLEGTLL